MRINISVIVPSYNSAPTIRYTLDSLLRKPSQYLKEIVVADSSDDEETKIILSQYSGKIRLVHLEKKTNPALARNAGAKLASGETLAFIDSDAFPASNWVEEIVHARRMGSVVGGGAIGLPDFQRDNRLALAQYYLQFNEFMGPDKKRGIFFVPSCNLFCENNIFKLIGGFPNIRASEDVLFGRLANSVSAVNFHPEIKVYHIFRNQLASYLNNQILLGKYILFYRRMGPQKFLANAWLAIPLIPVFVFIKFLRIAQRILKQRKNIVPFLSVSPLFMLGLFYWAIGFFQGCIQKNPEEVLNAI